MTRIANDPASFVDDALEGFAAAHAEAVRRVDGGVVRATPLALGSVAVVVGGGSGHYPAFAGVVGPGMAAGAVCGNIFTSPSAGQAYRVARAADAGGGVLFLFGNYAGDVLHFGDAQDRLRAEGVDARTVLVTDDIASAPLAERARRRGIAGDFVVFKIAGAAAERGDDIDEVERLARHANERTRTLGVAFGGCTFPGADAPLFTVPEGMMSIGLGIHGEPGIRDVPRTSSRELAHMLVGDLLHDVPESRGDRAAVIVNGLGSVSHEELFVLFRDVSAELGAAGVAVVQPEVGDLVTSLDMAGASVTLVWLDDELEPLWAAAADTPAYRKGAAVRTASSRAVAASIASEPEAPRRPLAAPDDRRRAEHARGLLRAAQEAIAVAAADLGALDAVAGDGDHGVGMRAGVDAAVAAFDPEAGLQRALTTAADAWSERAGGTSGALWATALRRLAAELPASGGRSALTPGELASAVGAAVDAVAERGGAVVGDKTMLDAMRPYADALRAGATAEVDIRSLLADAARAATAAAEATAALRPSKGRARPLAERSLGHPDPGATSFALIATAVARHLEQNP
ncbi:dihydroxyacetone kinase family protein [Microbacterium oleivorans]|uniref:dihydroxyacetone kinase family protein n=1 Tax=Microbacterium oleivorans TaxID=273677 RepID=UPI00203E4C6B|nr:dihydroxyacetone kinase family protein [Microbacterium oleivorans]MCM3695349.1 dihydroxyacetone kinase family protein [Microbacterium oleivorans]